MFKRIEAFWRREDGAGLTEYVVMAGGIAVAALVAVNGFSNTVADEWDGISGGMVWSTPAVEMPGEDTGGPDNGVGDNTANPDDKSKAGDKDKSSGKQADGKGDSGKDCAKGTNNERAHEVCGGHNAKNATKNGKGGGKG